MNILILEDDLRDAGSIEREIQNSLPLFCFKHVRTKTAFIRDLKNYTPEIVLISGAFRGLDRLTALRLVRDRAPKARAIIISKALSDEEAADCIKAGAADYVRKDRLTRLVPAIRKAVEKKRARDEREKAEMALRENEEKYRTLTENINIGMFRSTAGRQGRFLEANPAMYTMLGYETREEFLAVKPADIYWDSQDRAKFNAKLLRNGSIKNLESLLKRKDGSCLIVSETAVAVRDSKGRVRYYDGIIEDIYEKKLMERRVEHLNRILRAIRSVNQLITKETDRSRLLRRACKNLIETRGYFHAWIALTGEDGMVTETAEAGLGKNFLPAAKRFKSGDLPYCGEKALKQPDVLIIEDPQVSCSGCLLEDTCDSKAALCIQLHYRKRIYGILSVSLPVEYACLLEERSLFKEVSGDISYALHNIGMAEKHRKAENALRISESRLKKAQRVARLGCWDWDIVTDELYWSDEIYRIFGLKPQEFGATYEAFLNTVHPDDRALVMHAVDEAVYQRKPYNIEHRIVLPDNAIKVVNEQGEVTYDRSGKPVRMLGTVHDITERKEMERMLVQSEKMASLGTIAAGIVHEINNPMGYISSNLRMLEKYCRKCTAFFAELDAAIAKCLESVPGEKEAIVKKLTECKREAKIDFILEDMLNAVTESLEGSEKVNKIVSDMKDFSREGKFEMQKADINKGIEKTLNVIWNELKYKAKIRKELGGLPEITCDPQRINQVVMNILLNAVQAIEKHGTITIKTGRTNSYVFIQISDTGTGIPGKEVGKIFDAFYTTKTPGHGTGLGLSISYKIIRDHGGSIDVKSSVGRGTTFTVKLPLS